MAGQVPFLPIGRFFYHGLLGITDRGQIVGAYSAGHGGQGFVLDRGTFTTIDGPGAGTSPIGINNPKQIIGTWVTADGTSHGFVLDSP